MKTALRVIIYIVVVPVAAILLPIFIVESDFWADGMSGKYDHLLEWICPIAFLTFLIGMLLVAVGIASEAAAEVEAAVES